MSNTVTIHEMEESFLSADLSSYDTITYDDGLVSQLEHRHKFPNHRSIFFISPAFIQRGVNDLGQECMTLDHVKMLIDEGFEIGGHSYSHAKLGQFKNLVEISTYIMHDTKQCAIWFEKNLGFLPKSFAFPYNDDCKGVYKAVAKKFGFKELYGLERRPIETLLHN